MTEAEKALVDFILNMHWGRDSEADKKLNELRVAVSNERLTGNTKRKWMEIRKERYRFLEAQSAAVDALDIPDGVDFVSWDAEARKELETE